MRATNPEGIIFASGPRDDWQIAFPAKFAPRLMPGLFPSLVGTRCSRRKGSPLSIAKSRRRREIQSDAVDAVPQMGWRGTIIENVTEMATAIRAMSFGSHHAVTWIR